MVEIYDAFILAKQAIRVTKGTIEFYGFTLLKFLKWLEDSGTANPNELHERHVRQFLSFLTSEGKSDRNTHSNARDIKTFVRFLNNGGYIDREI